MIPISKSKPIQLGLCCLNLTLKENKPPIYSSRTICKKMILKMGIDEVKRRIELNIKDLFKILEWNDKHGIRVFRISSEIFPHISNPDVEDYDINFLKPLIKKLGILAKNLGQRLTMHPGQYNVIGTPDANKFKKTIIDLEWQAELLDIMECSNDSVMVVHGGGIYGDKKTTKKRWCEQFYKLPKKVQKRLVLENCEKCFNIEDCLEISKIINIPVVFDTHHYECYNLLHPDETLKKPKHYIPLILETWNRRMIKPKFHISEQGTGKCGHHSDYINKIPKYLLDIPEKYGVEIDIMIEAKKKELAIKQLYLHYPFLNCLDKNIIKSKIPRPTLINPIKPYKIEDVYYLENYSDLPLLDASLKLNWCKPPAGIPGNYPPRQVAVFGKPKERENIGYPLFQCAKSSTTCYHMVDFPPIFKKLVKQLRKSVYKLYGKRVKDINNLFNIAVCSRYTKRTDKISPHQDDERWLKPNLDNENSIIASLTLYVDEEPTNPRRFQIKDDDEWVNFNLHHNSILFFSNQTHRVLPLKKKDKNSDRINITFRTLETGLLGLVGYGNFYRYMSLPFKIQFTKIELQKKYLHYFNKLVNDLEIEIVNNKKIKKPEILPKNIKQLCSIYNIS